MSDLSPDLDAIASRARRTFALHQAVSGSGFTLRQSEIDREALLGEVERLRAVNVKLTDALRDLCDLVALPIERSPQQYRTARALLAELGEQDRG